MRSESVVCASVTRLIASSLRLFFFYLGYSVRKCGPDVRRGEGGRKSGFTPGSEEREILRRDEREEEEEAEKEEEEDRANAREETR